MLHKVNELFHEHKKNKIHVFSFPFVASHIMSSYFGFETCVECGDG
jgi:hypothetical protein